MEDQKQVKIIGLKVNNNFGILQSCNIEFDENNRLIPIKGEVGSGKTTLHKSLMLGSMGSETLKHDKNLYGPIDQEVQLLDGNTPIFVGCKSDKDGKLAYVIYTKDAEGKIVKDPIVDGVKLTPAEYLKSLQTALTWRMEELTSENPTEQKKILLDLYKQDLEKVGVIYDKSHPDYIGSILDQIEKAEARRAEKDYARKQVGGFAKHLQEQGYDVHKPETLPERVNVDELKSNASQIKFQLDNSIQDFESKKQSELQSIASQSESLTLTVKEYNMKLQSDNKDKQTAYETKLKRFQDGHKMIEEVCEKINKLCDESVILEDLRVTMVENLNKHNELVAPEEPTLFDLIPFSEDGKKCLATSWDSNEDIDKAIKDIIALREKYKAASEKTFDGDNAAKEQELEQLNERITLAESTNKICNAVDAFNAWSDANENVISLKKQYASKLKEINTGVDGLTIDMEEVGEKMNVHLMYNGAYSPEYFSNPEMQVRKLSSYSGTQKPMICLLIQNYLLSRKPKALRYLWIDNVPIDNKTKGLLNRMGETLNLTIFINITGDFDKDHLESGEILLEGGEVFFNKTSDNETI